MLRRSISSTSAIPTAQAIRGHYILREALETQAARIFAEKASASEGQEIQRLAVQLDEQHSAQATSREHLFEMHKSHLRFHMRIAECTGCEELCQAIEKNQILVFNWLYDTALGNQQPPPGWHSELASVLVNGDPEEADRAMRRHTRFRMEEVLMRMEPYFNSTQTQLATYVRRPRRKRP